MFIISFFTIPSTEMLVSFLFACGNACSNIVYTVVCVYCFFKNEIGHSFLGRAPVVLYRLRKEYHSPGGGPPYVAVQSVSLAIKKNECFHLLGPNC